MVDALERPHRDPSFVPRRPKRAKVVRAFRARSFTRHLLEVEGVADAPRAPAPERVSNLIEQDTIAIALSTRHGTWIEPYRDGSCSSHRDVVVERCIQTEDPAAWLDVARRVERGHLPLGVNARIGAARAAGNASLRIHRRDRPMQNVLHGSLGGGFGPTRKPLAVVGHREQDAEHQTM